jgi:hypothetical protein
MNGFKHRGFDQIVGLDSRMKENMSETHAYLDWLLDENGGKNIDKYEVEKTPREEELIAYAEAAADSFLRELGREDPEPVSFSNVHVLRKDGTFEFTDGQFQGGAHATRLASILVDRTNLEAKFAAVVFHELMHLKSYKALQMVSKQEGRDLVPYRSGLAVYLRDGKTVHMQSLEEAIVGYLTARFYNEKLMQDPQFAAEISSIAGTNEEEEIVSRQKELEKLNELVDDLWEQNQETYTTRDDVFSLFVSAQISGNLLPIARLIEQTYGKGSFRKYAEAVDGE